MSTIPAKLCSSGIGINPLIVIPSQSVEVREGTDIDVVYTQEGSKDVFTVSSNPLTAPTITNIITPSEAEVGDTIASAEFKVTINEGSEAIQSIVCVPDVGAFSAGVQKIWNVANVTRNTIGNEAVHTITVTDVKSNVYVFVIGIAFKARIFQGFTNILEPDEATLEALQDITGANGRIASSLLALYQGEKTYVVPAGALPKYIHWWQPVATVSSGPLSGLLLDGITPIPHVSGTNIFITNAFGVTLEYVHKRTSNSYGNISLDITME